MLPSRLWSLLLLLSLILVPLARADEDEAEQDMIPLTGRPTEVPFSDASGSFTVQTSIDRTTVQVEDPLIFVVRILARGPVRQPPRRLPLGEFPRFSEQFHIEDLPSPAGDAGLAGRLVGGAAGPGWSQIGSLFPPTEWVFRYRLKPKSTSVAEVPSLPFAFYDPRLKRFQVPYADAIPLKVSPRRVVEIPLQAPEEAFQLATGPGLLTTVRPWKPPGPAILILLLAAPPTGCLGWYLVWRRLYPDAARLARQRRSRAAQLLLDLLRKAPAAPQERAQFAERAVTRYLRLRLDLAIEEPTPGETAAHLTHRGLSEPMTAAISRFYQTCNAARFAPAPPAETPDLASKAAEVILAVEAEAGGRPKE